MRKVWGGVYLTLAAAIWGGMYVVSKYVLGDIPPLTLVVLRFAVGAFALFFVMILRRRHRVALRDLPQLALLGFVGFTVSVGTQNAGTLLTSAHTAALITSASPAFIVLFALWLLKERITRWKITGLALAMMGIGLITGGGGQGDAGHGLLGTLFLIVAAVTWALYTVLSKRITSLYGSLTVTAYAALFGTLLTLPLALLERQPTWFALPAEVWWGVLYLGLVSTAGAFYLWNKGFEYLDAGSGSVYFFLQPVVGTLLGWLLLGERPSGWFFAGGGLILAGTLVSMREAAKRMPGEV